MKEWAHTFGVAVHQRIVQQETTTGRAGTLPNFSYEKDIVPGESIVLTADVGLPDNEYDTSSSAEAEEIEDQDREGPQRVATLDGEANFLLGRIPHLVVLFHSIAGLCFHKRDHFLSLYNQCVYLHFPSPTLYVNN